MDVEKCIATLKNMERETFRDNIVAGVGKSRAMSAVMTCGAEKVPPEEKRELCLALQGVGIPVIYTFGSPTINDEIDTVCAAIAERMLDLR